MAYADDILITASTKQSLMDTFQQLKNYSLEVGLTINEKKTKYLKCTRKDIKRENININSSYTGCNRRNGADFRRAFLRSNYTDITQNTYIQS